MFALPVSPIKFNFTLNIFHRFTTNNNKPGKVLKIRFVTILIVTGVVLEVFNILDFSRSKKQHGTPGLVNAQAARYI